MRIIELRNYYGRNIYCHKPVTKMIIDLEDLFNVTTDQLKGFNEKFISLFPSLKTHYCSTGYEGGFVDRLKEGTYLPHVIEHLVLELQCLMGYDVSFGKTRIVKEPSLYFIVYEYINENCTKEFGRAAVEIVSRLARSEDIRIDEILGRLYRINADTNLGPSTYSIWREARKRDIPVRRLDKNSLLQLGYGKHSRIIEASLPDTTSCVAVDLAKDKHMTKQLLQENDIPVPNGEIVSSEKSAVLIANELGYPVVIKPLDGNQGKGVTANIDNEERLYTAYQLARRYSRDVVIEKYIEGKDYRILVVGNQVSAVAERKPPFVQGDGVHTIMELVAELNKDSNRGEGHEKPLTKIKLDTITKELLSRSGLTLTSIPKRGEIIYLRENGNLSTGGIAIDCTESIHPLNKELAVKAAKVIGLEIAGIDVVMDDISRPLTRENGAIIEVNAAPGLRMHLHPAEGKSRNVARDILDYIYSQNHEISIPIISITGTNGKTTVTRMIEHVLSMTGRKVGMTCSSGTYIGGKCISKGDNTGPLSAQLVLYNKEVEAAVLETARGGIIRKGLGYDLADIGIVTNVSEDHLGLEGVNSLEDMAFIKALVVEAIKPEGYAILNADDRMVDYIRQRVRCNLIYFSQNLDNPLLKQHIKQGGIAVSIENGIMVIYQNNVRIPIMPVQKIPITFEGQAICNIENSLAATAGLYAFGIPVQIIEAGLESFKPDPFINAGRFNLFDMGTFQVLLDYGHNPSGYKSVVEFIKKRDYSRLVGIIGVPGDRMDTTVFEVGRISGQCFDRIYIKEDLDLRGRKPGEIANLLYLGVISGGAFKGNVEIIYSEIEALKKAIDNALPGDLVVMFYENFEPALGVVNNYVDGRLNFAALPAFSSQVSCSMDSIK